jgi:hypothetical protein
MNAAPQQSRSNKSTEFSDVARVAKSGDGRAPLPSRTLPPSDLNDVGKGLESAHLPNQRQITDRNDLPPRQTQATEPLNPQWAKVDSVTTDH